MLRVSRLPSVPLPLAHGPRYHGEKSESCPEPGPNRRHRGTAAAEDEAAAEDAAAAATAAAEDAAAAAATATAEDAAAAEDDNVPVLIILTKLTLTFIENIPRVILAC